MQITGIILAGGKSSRIGTDKALLKVNGISLLENVIDLCKQVCNTLIISSNNPEHSKLGYPITPDEIKNCGPIGGIYTCLKTSQTDWNLVISVDSPFVEAEFLQKLISESENADAIIPFHSKGKEPLIALYNKSSLGEMEKKINRDEYKMYDLLTSLNTKFIDSEIWLKKYPKLFCNINRIEDLNL